jgi:hypothetical protein
MHLYVKFLNPSPQPGQPFLMPFVESFLRYSACDFVYFLKHVCLFWNALCRLLLRYLCIAVSGPIP